MAKDIFHENVRQALIKEGWSITSDPLHIDLDETYPLNNTIVEWKK